MNECAIPEEEPAANNFVEEDSKNQWALYVNSSSNANRTGEGLILASPEGDIIQHALRFKFFFTNNKAEYEALVASLKISKELGVQHLKACNDSQLIVSHVQNEYELGRKI